MTNKVVWSEGMTLDPHHFQQSDRFHQANLNFRLGGLSPFAWGVRELVIDKEALVNGQFRLLRCAGVEPDGLVFNMPETDQLPEQRNFQELFLSNAETLGVFLAVPVERPDGHNCVLRNDNPEAPEQGLKAVANTVRFVEEQIRINDDSTGENARQIGVAQTNYQVRFSGEALDNLSAFKIAEIVRTGDGRFSLSENFIPPCLTIGSAGNMQKLLGRLLELMVAKSSALSKWRHRLPSGQIRFLTTDFTVLGVLQAINGFIPLMNHYRVGGINHPERLYEILTSLVGQLTTFSTADAADLPHYDHAALGDCFGQLEAKIQEILGEITGANYISILLEKTREALYVGRLVDDFVLEEAGFYLLASGEAVDRDTVEKLSAAIKIASPETIDAVFESMTEGLGIHTTEEPPAGLPEEPGKYYFRLDKQGPFWEAICRSRSIAIWTPADFVNFKIELIAVR